MDPNSRISTRALILIVEDDPRLRLLIAEFLRGEGFGVDVAGSGAEALKQISWERPDLLLLDIHLPDMTAVDLVNKLRQRDLEVPILAMTAAYDASEWARRIGAVSYIPKPVSLPRLLRRLDELCA